MHSVKSRAFIKLILFASFAFLFLILLAHKNLRTDLLDLFEGIKINLSNTEKDMFPERKRPFSVVRQETELELLLPDPFINFTIEDWRRFWDLIYGLHGYDIPDNPRLPYTNRQLTFPELEKKLAENYEIFEGFQGQHWEEFWKIVLRKKRFQRSW